MVTQLALPSAWARVAARRGMPGVDGQDARALAYTVDQWLPALAQELARGHYRPLPLRQAQVIRHETCRTRHLLVPTVRDRVVQTALAGWVARQIDPFLDENSFAYRPGRGLRDALRAVARLRDRGLTWVLRADVRDFFDRVSHERLLAITTSFLDTGNHAAKWIQDALEAPSWDGISLECRTAGLPQGSPLSPHLANVYLSGFDRQLREHGVAFVRYADDIVIAAGTPATVAESAALVRTCLRGLGLELAETKTRITSFEKGFAFLGAWCHGERILVPFEPGPRPPSEIRVAPAMPPALLRAYAAGFLTPCRPRSPVRSDAGGVE